MEKELLNYVKEKTKQLIAAPSCCKELKEMGEKWLEAVGTNAESAVTRSYVAELEADITPIDGLINLTESETGVKIFGEERAKAMLEHAKEIKANGAKYCDCSACTAALAILEKKDELLR